VSGIAVQASQGFHIGQAAATLKIEPPKPGQSIQCIHVRQGLAAVQFEVLEPGQPIQSI
jgi:hypothetical protein